jgi:hypothetical protein
MRLARNTARSETGHTVSKAKTNPPLSITSGSIVRVGPNDLITSDPNLMKRMLNVRTPYKRSEWYDAMRLNPTKDNVLSMRNDDVHNQLRTKMAAGV